MSDFANAVLFSKSGDQRQLGLLASKAIVTLSASWSGVPRRHPWMNGRFQASMLRPEDIAVETGYSIDRHQRITVLGDSYELPEKERLLGGTYGQKKPDILALCVGKRPAFVSFYQAGYDVKGLFTQAMEVAAALVAQGYLGGIHCYSDANGNSEFDNPERCVISFDKGDLLKVRIHWGDEILIGPLLDFCRAENFREELGWEEYERRRKTA